MTLLHLEAIDSPSVGHPFTQWVVAVQLNSFYLGTNDEGHKGRVTTNKRAVKETNPPVDGLQQIHNKDSTG